MNSTDLLLFVAVAAGLTLTPGADTLLVIKNSLRGGRSAGWATTLGISAGLLAHAAVSALGLSTLLTASPGAMSIVQGLGALYLVALGVRAMRPPAVTSQATEVDERARPDQARGWRSDVVEGLLTNLLNPKIVVFYLALLPPFIAPGQPVLVTSLGLAAIHVAMGMVWLGLLSALIARGAAAVSAPKVQRRLTTACGAMLMALGLHMLASLL